MVKKILIVVFLILLGFCLWNWNWIKYGFQQAKGQLEIIINAKPIAEFLSDPNYPDSLKNKLQLTQIVRQFAIDSLGLHNSDNYTKMYDQKGEVLLWNLSAAYPYELKPYYWTYPFLGKMPYKGFFEIEKAKEEAETLKEDGLDVRIRAVGGWSTLGILEDPILSEMLNRSDGALAELIIHELTHATIFIKNEIEFNENLASFIGERGAEQFLISHFGDSSVKHLEYIRSLSDSKKFNKVILSGTQSLDSLYHTFNDSMSIQEKDTLKWRQIRSIRDNLELTPFYNSRYNRVFSKTLPNNAYFMALKRYHSQEDSISDLYSQSKNDLLLFLTDLKKQHGK